MPRNGHLSLHVVITGPAGSNYLLYTGTNPPDILRVKLYREYFTPCGNDFCPDWLVEQASPTFGAIPEFRHDLARPAMDRQTTRCYLLDIWAPPDTPPRRVRVEALLKTGIWQVAPLEVRILAPILEPISEQGGRTPNLSGPKMWRHWMRLRAPPPGFSCSAIWRGFRRNCLLRCCACAM